jgi:hypothetical protein
MQNIFVVFVLAIVNKDTHYEICTSFSLSQILRNFEKVTWVFMSYLHTFGVMELIFLRTGKASLPVNANFSMKYLGIPLLMNNLKRI